MKIRFAIIDPGILEQVRAEVDTLRNAVNAGDMDGVDCATAKLVDLTVNCRSIDLTEEEWRGLLEQIRRENPEFESSYLLPGEICTWILPSAAAGECVLQLPIDDGPEKEVPDV
jgi:hypothetical protein